MTTELAVKLRDIRQRFGKQRVLRGADLSVPRGSVVGLVGPSGSGKSTLVAITVGLVRPTSGSVEVLGGAPTSAQIKQRIGYMPQSTALYDDLTAQENLAFFGALYGMTRAELQEVIPHALQTAQLEDTGRKLVRDFSGGMARRLSLAAALLHRPDLLVLDEPTVGLDPRHRVALWETFHTLADEGHSLLITTHVMEEAESCDEVALLFNGRVLATGSPTGLKERANTTNLEGAFLAFQDALEGNLA